jgi:hypothetical protein
MLVNYGYFIWICRWVMRTISKLCIVGLLFPLTCNKCRYLTTSGNEKTRLWSEWSFNVNYPFWVNYLEATSSFSSSSPFPMFRWGRHLSSASQSALEWSLWGQLVLAKQTFPGGMPFALNLCYWYNVRKFDLVYSLFIVP